MIFLPSLHEASRRHFHNPRIHLVRADLRCLPFRDEIFKQIVCSEVLEHVPERGKAVKEFHRILKRNRFLIISTPNTLSLYYPQKLYLEKKYGSIHPYDCWKNYWSLRRELKNSGFEVVNVRGACMLPGYICYTNKIKNIIKPLLPLFEKLEKLLYSKPPLSLFSYVCIVRGKKTK